MAPLSPPSSAPLHIYMYFFFLITVAFQVHNSNSKHINVVAYSHFCLEFFCISMTFMFGLAPKIQSFYNFKEFLFLEQTWKQAHRHLKNGPFDLFLIICLCTKMQWLWLIYYVYQTKYFKRSTLLVLYLRSPTRFEISQSMTYGKF